jgi:hypothetical protein
MRLMSGCRQARADLPGICERGYATVVGACRSAEGNLEEVRQLGVAVGNVSRLGGERREHVAQAAERLVDGAGLLGALPLRLGPRQALTATPQLSWRRGVIFVSCILSTVVHLRHAIPDEHYITSHQVHSHRDPFVWQLVPGRTAEASRHCMLRVRDGDQVFYASQVTRLPARSTRLRAPRRVVPEASWRPVMASMNTECEREEVAFMAVASHARATAARRTSAAATSDDATGVTVAPTTCVCPPAVCTSLWASWQSATYAA